MTAPTPSPTISAAPPAWTAADWNALRAAGLAAVERLAHALWTDYNRHDPGITILELLCYAITDLSQRSSLDIKDLVRTSYGSPEQLRSSFRPVHEVLPGSPVTELDYRKLLLDVGGVRNVWLRPHQRSLGVILPDRAKYQDPSSTSEDDPALHARLLYLPTEEKLQDACQLSFELRGLYDIIVDVDPTSPLPPEQVLRNVRRKYLKYRNLGEDCVQVLPLPVQPVVLCADVDLAPGAHMGEVYTELLRVVDGYLCPPVKRYTLEEMLALTDANGQPLTMDQVFEGPLLRKGFIRDEELQTSALREVVHASDLIALAMAIPGVQAIRDLRLSALVENPDYDPKKAEQDPKGYTVPRWLVDRNAAGQAWTLPLRAGARPELDAGRSTLNFYHGVLPVGGGDERTQALARFEEQRRQASRQSYRRVQRPAVPAGTEQDLHSYRPLALDFPANYGIGPAGLPDDASPERHHQVQQLRAYLLFFDQLLANYLGQLQQAAQLFSTDPLQRESYFGQVLGNADLAGLETLYANGTAPSPARVASPEPNQARDDDRRHRFLDHLLARFAENFSEYGLLMYSLYGASSTSDLLVSKAALAQDLGRFRPARGYNYHRRGWYNHNVPGIVRRFARLAGMSDFRARFSWEAWTSSTLRPADVSALRQEKSWVKVSDDPQTGVTYAFYHQGRILTSVTGETDSMARASLAKRLQELRTDDEVVFVVDHVLLLPEPDPRDPRLALPPTQWLPACVDPDGHYCEPLDPYSYRVSIVLPGYTERFGNMDYRQYAERVLRAELPAHVMARICWVNEEDLRRFSDIYAQWMDYKQEWSHRQLNDELDDNFRQNYASVLRELVAVLDSLHTLYPEGRFYDCDTQNVANPLVLGRTTLGSL